MLLLTTAGLPQLEQHRAANLGRLVTPRHFPRLFDTLEAGFRINGSTFFASGGSGNDFFGCDEATCNFFGGSGDDFMAAGSVEFFGGTWHGGLGNDRMSINTEQKPDPAGIIAYGDKGKDILEIAGPHENSSRLYGGAHNDQLRGDGDDDELHGGTGADILEGRRR